MSDTPTDIPEAATRRLGEGAFSSGLSVPDFAACLQMGLEPVGLVQGFCAMQWSPYAGGLTQRLSPYSVRGSEFVQNYQCPHGFVGNDHRMWGQNYQQPWIENAWSTGFASAFQRMMEEATDVHAHGVVGVVDSISPLAGENIIEFHLHGTAVRATGASAPSATPFSTYLAGQRLAKVVEAGYSPVSIVAAVSSVRVWAYCMTEYLLHNSGVSTFTNNAQTYEIDQISNARLAARKLVLNHSRSQLAHDSLHGVSLRVHERELGEGDMEVQCLLRGNRLRRFKPFDALATPQPTVRLT